jgi:cyclin-dependent kinase regulatory subunit CKS1
MDSKYEYRHVLLPRIEYEKIRHFKCNRLLTEFEWRSLGVQQSLGWAHFMWHRPEPHVLIFRRPIGTVMNILSMLHGHY